jgi:type II secretory pathway pseudopilin PulG
MRRTDSGFGPVHPVYWFFIELSLAVAIIGLAIGLAMSSYKTATFKARLTEALIGIGMSRVAIAEGIALTGGWDAAEDDSDTGAAPVVTIDAAQSIEAAERDLRRRGGTFDSGTDRSRIMRLESSIVVLIRYPEWPGTGVLSFRPAVPDVDTPSTVILHCGPGSGPRGWIAAPERVAGNLPASYLPWMCRGDRRG